MAKVRDHHEVKKQEEEMKKLKKEIENKPKSA